MSLSLNVMRVGDEVIFKRGDDYYPFQGDPAKDSMKGTIVGKHRDIRYSPRINAHSRRLPGIYEQDGSPIITWEDGTTSTPNTWKIELTDRKEHERRMKAARQQREEHDWDIIDDKLMNTTRLADLPFTKAWEHDYVRCDVRSSEYGFVLGVEYDQEAKNKGETVYRVQFTNQFRQPDGGYTYLSDSQIEVAERGNVWAYYHQQPMFFPSIAEEAKFHHDMGKATTVRYKDENGFNSFNWDIADAVEAVMKGEADCFGGRDGILTYGHMALTVYTFDDQDLALRLRQATQRMFGSLKKNA